MPNYPSLKIEHGIKVPEKRGTRYPWRRMGVGDSFFAPNGNMKNLTNGAYNAFGKGHYAVRHVVEGGVAGYRVWRLEGGE